MTRKELYDAVVIAKQRLEQTISSGFNSSKEREAVKNLLFNNLPTVIMALDEQRNTADPEEVATLKQQVEDLKQENETLEDELAKADATVKSLKQAAKAKTVEVKASGGT